MVTYSGNLNGNIREVFNMSKTKTDFRKERGLQIAKICRIEKNDNSWIVPMSDMIFVSTLKVYSTFSLRRFTNDIENPELTPILKQLITVTSLPLKAVELKFAVEKDVSFLHVS